MIKITGTPLAKLPGNAVRAVRVSHVVASVPMGSVDYGIFQERADKNTYRLMTWGANLTRETVETYSRRRFVWTGLCSIGPGKGMRDNFEEVR